MSDRKPASRVHPGDLSTLVTECEVIVGVSQQNLERECNTCYITSSSERVQSCWHRGSTIFVIAWSAQ